MAEEGAVAVCVRVRPLNTREEALGEATQVYWKTGNNTIYQVDGSKSFNFDRVFHSNETTKNVYEEIAVPIIDSAIQGYNGTIFAYGQTASGKTYTMMGSEDYLGVIPRAIHDIFQKIKEFPEREFLLRVSYMEIYNETITDLLCDTRKMKPLIIREDFNRNVYVSDLTEEVVYTSEMALKWITKGEKNRHYGITKMNQRSSRSHTIFRMILESREKGDPSNCEGAVKVSHLNLVDLAGSERAAQTGAEGVRLKEGCNINRSLFILGQVIKKLSDGQVGGFINYRDSKLTRILQNSLGGNAKTRIICTITPVSFDETLTTLQFASTAKYMKNTPYVNEVSSDEALLKRYRKEIMDLKKQLEEVSLETRAQAMEKDQLAQLLEEKDLLQKVQIEKIENLTRMLVTSSSLTSQQELKAKKKRRVTWCLGKINKMKDSNYVNEFNMTANITTKTHKTAVTLGEIDESICSEYDVFSNTLDTLTEIEWNPATKLLSQETLESELNSLRSNYDSLVLEYEQLRRENEEMELKLKEKNDLDEFEALERKTEKDQEMQLIHEISNLKNLVKHAEVYNQDLEKELSSKVELLKEKEEQIKKLQEYINSQKSENIKTDLSFSMENTEDLKQMKQTLFDAETVALDAKRESAFLRSENLELKEKMKGLSSMCEQMKNDIQLFQSQLEAKKKMQVDLEKELQSAFSEITKLTSLVDGKVSKDLLCNLELENRITDLQKELNKEIEENTALHKEVNLLSELKSLSPEVEMLRNELSLKTQELQQKTIEDQERLNEMEQLKKQLENSNSRLYAVEKEKTLITEKLQQTLEEVRAITQEKDNLKQFQESLQIERDQLKSDIQETVNMNIDTQEQLRNALESLKQHQETINTLKMKISEGTSRNIQIEENIGETMDEFQEKMTSIDKKQDLETKNTQTLIADVGDNELIEQQRKIFSLIQEKNDLQQKLESITAEKEQLKTDLKENIEMTIENQEELRILGDELKKQQEIITREKYHNVKKEEEHLRTCERLAEVEEKLKEKSQQLQENQQQLLSVRKEMSELQKEMNEMEILKNKLKNKELILEHVEMERLELAHKIHENQEEMKSITEERNDLKKLQESFEIERDQLKRYISETEATVPALHEELKLPPNVKEVIKTQETMDELELLKGQSKAKDSTLASIEMERLRLILKLQESHEEIKSITKERDDLKTTKEALQVEYDQLKEDIKETLAKILEAQEKQEQSFNMKAKDNETKKMVNEMEQLKEQFKAKDSALLKIEKENLKLCERLQKSHGEIKSITQERDHLKRIQEDLQSESDQLKKNIGEIIANHLETEEELKAAHFHLKEREETIDKLRVNVSQRETEISSIQKELESTNEELLKKIQELHEKQEHLLNVKEISEAQEKLNELEQFKEYLKAKDSALQSVESEKLKLTERLQESQEEIKIIIKERDELKRVQKPLQMERDQLKENIKEIVTEGLETKENLKTAFLLNEHQETISTPSRKISEETKQVANVQRDLENSDAELKEKVQELQEKEYQLCKIKDVSETQEIMCEMEQLKRQFEAQKSTLENIEMENIRLTQRLHENLEEMRSVTKERDSLRSIEETLKVEREQLNENLRETVIRDLKKQEELKVAHMHLKEHQETIDKLRRIISEKSDELSNMQMDLENSNATLKGQIQELQEKEHELLEVKNDLRENLYQTEQLKKQLEIQNSTLDSVEAEKLKLTEKLHENLEEMKCLTKESDNLRRVEEALKMERDQLRESLRETEAKDLRKQEELKIVHLQLKEHQKTVNILQRVVSEKADEISNMQRDLENSNAKLEEKIQELKANEHQLLMLQEDVSEAQKNMFEIERLKKQFKAQSLTLEKIEMENLNLAQKLHENLEEMKSVMKERDNLRKVEETLILERDQLKEKLQETTARDQQNHKEVLTCEGKQHLTENLREKCFRIRELLKRYSEMDNEYECLNRLSSDLEKEIETQKELSNRVKANLSLPYPQTKQIQKLLTANQRCSMEFLRVTKKLKFVLSHVTKIKEEHHESVNKFEMGFIDEVEKQNELLIQTQHLQQNGDVPSKESRDLKLNQNLDLHIEEILKDFSKSDFLSIKTEFQQVLNNRKEMTQFLQEWLNTHFDIEKLKNGIQEENDRICQVNSFYNNKIIAIMNESTEFEERAATILKKWEHDLKSVKEKNEKMSENYQTLKASMDSSTLVNPDKNPHVTVRATQLTTEKIQELETLLHEAEENAKHKERKIIKMQKELEITNGMIAKLEVKVNESNKCLEKTKEMIQVLEDKVALGAEPYKEEIEDLKMKLVKIDLEKIKNAKEFEKEITSTKATVEYQKEVIRLLRENLRRHQQTQDTSMVSECNDSQPSNKPLTCGGGSGIIQSTKALILKSEYIRLEKEISKLKQKNEQLIKQQNELLSNNHHLSKEVKTWKERTLKREAHKEVTCENSPKSPNITGTPSKKGQNMLSQCKERNLQDPAPKESPKSWFFDHRSKSFPVSNPVRYFDNSGLGLCPEVQTAGDENMDPQPGPWHTSSGKDVPECKTQ